MKKYTHAWLGLKAVELLKSYKGKFSDERNKRLEDFLEFIDKHPSTFVKGAWFPDTVIRDNIQGGHTWKYSLDGNGKVEKRRPPDHNLCQKFVTGSLNKKIKLETGISDLPDRCEALGQTIRDSIIITNNIKSGDVLSFNNSQIALFFLMLSHYVADAHMPNHCDTRDFYKPSKIHPDIEAYWEKEVKKFHKVSTKREQFDLDEDLKLQVLSSKSSYQGSIIDECNKLLATLKWKKMKTAKKHWSAFLGSKNNNFWDYLVGVCLVSFHLSVKILPINPPAGVSYKSVRVMKTSPFKEEIIKYSPAILADAISSIALLWYAAWERWELLEKGIR